jgi:hypothetical protein
MQTENQLNMASIPRSQTNAFLRMKRTNGVWDAVCETFPVLRRPTVSLRK